MKKIGESIYVANMTFGKFQDYFELLKGSVMGSKSDIFRSESLNQIPAEVFYKTSKTIVNWSKSGDLYNLFYDSPIPKLLTPDQIAAISVNQRVITLIM